MTIRSENIEELELKLIEKNKYVATVEQKISFRPKGQKGRWTSELNKAKKQRDLIASDIKRLEAKPIFEETEAFYEKEVIRKERERVLALFKEYKKNPIIAVPKIQRKKPDFGKNSLKIIDRNYEELINAQRDFDSAKQRASKRSAVGTGDRASQLQRARNRLKLAIFDLEHEPIVIENRELRNEKKWLDTVLLEQEADIKEAQALIDKHERNFALFVKHGLIELKK